jgi:hypothetical protein
VVCDAGPLPAFPTRARPGASPGPGRSKVRLDRSMTSPGHNSLLSRALSVRLSCLTPTRTRVPPGGRSRAEPSQARKPDRQEQNQCGPMRARVFLVPGPCSCPVRTRHTTGNRRCPRIDASGERIGAVAQTDARPTPGFARSLRLLPEKEAHNGQISCAQLWWAGCAARRSNLRHKPFLRILLPRATAREKWHECPSETCHFMPFHARPKNEQNGEKTELVDLATAARRALPRGRSSRDRRRNSNRDDWLLLPPENEAYNGHIKCGRERRAARIGRGPNLRHKPLYYLILPRKIDWEKWHKRPSNSAN